MTDPFLVAVRCTLTRFGMVGAGGQVLVGLSGGADSVALLAALVALSPELGFGVSAAHLDHGLRGAGGGRDESVAREVAARFDVPYRAGALEPGRLRAQHGGLEQAARRARYEYLRETARELGCEKIATGHTLDDQAETVLLRLVRGSGLTGLAGIQPVRRDGVIRPLIDVSRRQVVAYLAQHKLKWAEDASNRDLRFTRNRIRLETLPALRQLNPRIADHLVQLADASAQAAWCEDRVAAELLQRCGLADGGLAAGELSKLPVGLQCVVLRRWLLQARGSLRQLGTRHLQALASLSRSGGQVMLPQGQRVMNEHGCLRLYRCAAPGRIESRSLPAAGSVTFGRRWRLEATAMVPACGAGPLPVTLWEAVFDADHVALPFTVRSWKAGDRIRPLNMGGGRKLSDVFVDRKVPRLARATMPVVAAAGGEVLWVPGVVRADGAKVTDKSGRVIRLRASRLDQGKAGKG